MLRTLFAAVAAFALFASQPARACEDCKQGCPKHKVAAAEEKKEAKPAPCACHAESKGECKSCGEKCTCAHCGAHKKAEERKS
jgi:hypothetical protein